MREAPIVATPEGDAAPVVADDVRLRFAGFVLDLGACTLVRDTGEAIALTRGELTLLRQFVRRPGRMLSRDHLLDAVAGRRSEPFDRSIDVLVGRLRRKIEPDPKQPSLIVTVLGEGYRFDAAVAPAGPRLVPPADAPSPPVQPRAERPTSLRSPRRVHVLAALCLLVLAVGGAWRLWPTGAAPSGPPTIAVLPFANVSGDSIQDDFGTGMAWEISTLLGTFPGLHVMSSEGNTALQAIKGDANPVQTAKALGVRYVVAGGVQRLHDRLRVTAQLYDGATGTALWADRFDASDTDPLAFQQDIANRVSDSLAGLRGRIRSDEERAAWRKSSPSLDEYDYYVRGLSFYFRFNLPDMLRSQAILREGLDRFPDSALLRIKLAFTHNWMVMNQASTGPRADIERTWQLAKAAEATESKSPLVVWMLHWLMAYAYQWHDQDFVRSVAEARAAVALVPYDAMSRNDLSSILANAGHAQEAVAWAKIGLEHDPNGSIWYRLNLAWALYVGGRYEEALGAIRDDATAFPAVFAAICVRLGRVEEARSVIAASRKAGSLDTVALEGLFPQIEPDRTAFLDDLRTAGLPEK